MVGNSLLTHTSTLSTHHHSHPHSLELFILILIGSAMFGGLQNYWHLYNILLDQNIILDYLDILFGQLTKKMVLY
jgi:hypothetical protein